MGLTIQTGLIYAGLAGARRWPSGRRSTNTLWSRIAGMHLAGRHEFSTFRRTLGSIHAAANESDAIDEATLTDWMTRHLKVRAAVCADADALGRLEVEVLRTIDPPLNLQECQPRQSARASRSCARSSDAPDGQPLALWGICWIFFGLSVARRGNQTIGTTAAA